MSETTTKRFSFIVNVIYAAIVISLCYIGYRLAGVVLPFVLALILTSVLNPLVRFIHRKLKIAKKALSVFFMLLLYAAVGTLLFFLVTEVIFLLRSFVSKIPEYYETVLAPGLAGISGSAGELSGGVPPTWLEAVQIIITGIESAVANIIPYISEKGLSFVTGLISGLPRFFISFVFTILLSFFISAQYDTVTGFIKQQLPSRLSEKTGELIALLKGTVLKYFKAVLILMLITFAELAIGFAVIGVSNPLGKAAGIAVFDALPIFGTGGIMIPWAIVELLQQNYSMAIALAVIYAIVTVVRNIIEPKIVSDQLGLNPIVSLVSIYIGYRVFGVFGMIFCPIAAQVILTLHKNGYIKLYKSPSPPEEPVTAAAEKYTYDKKPPEDGGDKK